MKSRIQNIPTSLVEDDWTKSIPTYYNKYNNFKVGNQITYPFSYVEKHWMDPRQDYTDGDSMAELTPGERLALLKINMVH